MPEARKKRTLKALAGALIAAALVVAPMVTAGASAAPKDKGPATAPTWPSATEGVKGELVAWTNQNNHADFWKTYVQDGDTVVCFDGQSSAHGKLTDGGLTVTLEPFNQDWEGDHWELLVIKAGSDWNNVIVHPQAGVAYASPPNSGGKQAQVSHWTVCKGTTPPTTQPDPEVSQRVTTDYDCTSGVVTTTTIYTTIEYIKNRAGEWQLGTPVDSAPVIETRLLTDEERTDCPTDTTVVYSEWKDGVWSCGDTTVDQTRTATTTTTVGGKTSTETKTETQTRALTQDEIGTCPLVPGDIEATCVGDVPYLSYDVALPEGFEAGENPVTITFLNPDGADYVVTGKPLSGKILWPGASDGEPKMWPGWDLVDGEYVQTEGNFAWTRDKTTVRFDVNPTYSTVVVYPQASADCANPPVGSGEEPEEPTVPGEPEEPTVPTVPEEEPTAPTEPGTPTEEPTDDTTGTPAGTPSATPVPAAEGSNGDLAVTGGGVSPIVVAAGGAALAAGVAVVTFAAYRRRRAGAE
ncbi:hypothetical protein IF188_12715 [Microbacterium sp. NEAU-LLC]|uniref:LPXTG-motif cell wall anchor domain-containing protein n=1 Tax=Microbacterium helvum TaxID=2773713 RepID=A0ABR8NPI6_9MICO|nr:hypothetical protein [Microbacterium helvum]MBD3942560.1 hypothetical protein [Microbacterium helvum]